MDWLCIIFMNSIYKLPFMRSFKGGSLGPNRVVDVRKYLGEDIYENLATAYKNLCSAIEENDLPYIRGITHPDLYKFLKEQLANIQDNKLVVKSTLSESNSRFTDQQKICSSNDFQSMSVSVFGYLGLTMETRSEHPNMKFFPAYRAFYYFKSLMDVLKYPYEDQLLGVFVEVNTKNKLYLKNDQGDLIQGETAPDKYVRSVLRFETNSNQLNFQLTDINYSVYLRTTLKLVDSGEAEPAGK